MLAKPEYSSPPDEVCCWPGRRSRAAGWLVRRGRAAGRECHGEEDDGTVAENYRERKIVKSRSEIMKRRHNSAELDNSCADGEIVVV